MSSRVIERLRHETRRRVLQVAEVSSLSRSMRRIVVTGEDLQGFTSAGFDDHVKLFFAPPGQLPAAAADSSRGEGERPPARDFTPRAYHPGSGRLTLDFALHDAGPAAAWANTAQLGDTLVIGGPRGSMIVPTDFDAHLLIGDETALPAISRRLEELPPDRTALAVLLVDEEADTIAMPEHPGTRIVWAYRNGAARTDAFPLLAALAATTLPPGDIFAFAAAESTIAKQVRAHLLARGLRREWIKAAGYWRAGDIAVHDKHED